MKSIKKIQKGHFVFCGPLSYAKEILVLISFSAFMFLFTMLVKNLFSCILFLFI